MQNEAVGRSPRVSVDERRQYVLSILEKKGSVSVSELSEYFSISEVSVRKLLVALENEHLLQRRWGGAVKPIRTMNELTYQVRETNYLPEKMAIAKPTTKQKLVDQMIEVLIASRRRSNFFAP